MSRALVRMIHLAMALYLAMSAVELLDRTGIAAEQSALAATAETLRDARSGYDPFGLFDEIGEARDAIRRLGDGLDDAAESIN